MVEEEKIKVLKQAIKILKIGKPCPQVDLGCCVCRAYIAIAVIEDHIGTLEWESK